MYHRQDRLPKLIYSQCFPPPSIVWGGWVVRKFTFSTATYLAHPRSALARADSCARKYFGWGAPPLPSAAGLLPRTEPAGEQVFGWVGELIYSPNGKGGQGE